MAVPLWLNVIGTALALGIVHVLTGPDHLSALSTLSVGKPLKTAFGLGVRWGCGHSFGLLIVAIIFFAVGQKINLDVLSYWADLFVGIFMILLGVWYILKAWRERIKYLKDKEDREVQELLQKGARSSIISQNGNQNGHRLNINNGNNNNNNNNNNQYDMNKININQDDDNDTQEEQIELQEINDNDEQSSKDKEDDNNKDKSGSNSNDDESQTREIDDNSSQSANDHPFIHNEIFSEVHQLKRQSSKSRSKSDSYQNGGVIIGSNKNDDIIPDDDMIIDGNASLNPLFDKEDGTGRTKCITRLAAFIAGIFHGIAGPGGVLGVMVALKLNDWFLSSLYLILFFISSILTMGVYAIIYGYCTQRMTVCANNKHKCAFILKIVSAIFSLIVGILWLSLTFTGTLEQWFD